MRGFYRVATTGEIHLNWTDLNDRSGQVLDLNWPEMTWTDLTWKNWPELNWTEKNGRFQVKKRALLGRFGAFLGRFWGVLGRFGAFLGVLGRFLSVFGRLCGSKKCDPFFLTWTELNWGHYWQVQIFLTWTELNWMYWNDLISVQFRIQVSFIWKSHLSSGPWGLGLRVQGLGFRV